RVFGIVGGGGLADRVVVHERHVVGVPDRLDDREAAAVPEAFLTAHDAIVTQAGLGAGDVLLVNGANGGVGIAAVQVGRLVGARVIASARSEEARGRLAELGAEAVAPDDAHEGVREAWTGSTATVPPASSACSQATTAASVPAASLGVQNTLVASPSRAAEKKRSTLRSIGCCAIVASTFRPPETPLSVKCGSSSRW